MLLISLEILDDNDRAPKFLVNFSQRTFVLCRESLTKGMNGDAFLAMDDDQGNIVQKGPYLNILTILIRCCKQLLF